MKLNDAGMALIERWEGFRSKPYLCPANIPTIGYGTTVYPNGRRVTLKDAPISKEIARTYKMHDLDKFVKGVTKLLTDKVNENRFSALVSFAYNVGIGALSGSTLLKMVNVSPGSPGIRDEFMRWNKAKDPKTKKLRELTGLTNRRRAEADLYFSVG